MNVFRPSSQIHFITEGFFPSRKLGFSKVSVNLVNSRHLNVTEHYEWFHKNEFSDASFIKCFKNCLNISLNIVIVDMLVGNKISGTKTDLKKILILAHVFFTKIYIFSCWMMRLNAGQFHPCLLSKRKYTQLMHLREKEMWMVYEKRINAKIKRFAKLSTERITKLGQNI